MKTLLVVLVIAVAVEFGDAFSKYGRSCKDIGCTSNQVCVMKEDPCSLHSKNNECGMYPSCQRVSNAAASCDTYVCPPTQICKLDNGQPRCYDDPGSNGMKNNKQLVQSYNPGPPSPDAPSAPVLNTNNYPQNPISPNMQNYPVRPNYQQNPNPPFNPNYPSNPNYPQQNYPTNPNTGLYPNLPSGGGSRAQTTSRPNLYQPGQQPVGGGYQGGTVGSGYPGATNPRQGGGYPVQSGGYPSQGGGYPGYSNQGSGYPSQGGGYPGYPSQSGGYPSQRGGYPSQSGGYPTQSGGYPSQSGGYPSQGGGYPGYPSQQGNYPKQQGGYNNYPSQGKQPSGQDSSIPYLDKITNTLKTIGLFWFVVKFVISRGNCIFS